MLFASRRLAFVLLVAALALGASGCNSNAKKIVGKWKLTGGGGIPDEAAKFMEAFKATIYMDFKADNSVTFGLEMSDPELQKKMDGKEKQSSTFKYKVGGDTIELIDIPKELQDNDSPFGKNSGTAKGTLKIEGDNLTITLDDLKDKPLKLTKMK